MNSAKYIIRRFAANNDANNVSSQFLKDAVAAEHAKQSDGKLEQIQDLDKDHLNLSSPKARGSPRDREFFLPANAPLFLMKPDIWMPRHRFKFFVSSQRLKHVLVEFMGLPPGAIRVLDRYKLFPARRPGFSFEASSSFVLAQQAHTGKNLELSLAFIQALKQNRRFKNHPIYLCGPQKLDAATLAYGADSRLFSDVYDLGNLGTNWIKHPLFRKSVFVNLSTYAYEDFGVSLAQAQAGGLPVLLSDWFAHGDARGEGTSLLPFEEIKEALGLKSINRAGKKLAEAVLRSRNLRSGKTHKLVSPSRHTSVTGQEIEQMMSRLSSRDRLQLSVFFEPVQLDSGLRFRLAPDVVSLLGGQR